MLNLTLVIQKTDDYRLSRANESELILPLTAWNQGLQSFKVKFKFETGGHLTVSKPIRSQKPNPLPDRKVLDDMVFDILGLIQQEREEVYLAVCELVKNRLEKARSV